ncbi:TRAP transporter substrate-binding protein [Balneatrix alpica]|uniref:TRAP transporter substrate-binding protein n=1 Tax=Balneatrix alpica TaxID=75684 RepID=UPI002739407F|nr:TRAP transporter substrate-binding protein [Balneatrix alpica]
MKKLVKTLTALALGASLGLTSLAQAAEVQNRIIRFGYGLNEDSNQGRAVNYFAEELKRLSDGKLKVKGFAGASLGSDMQMQNALIGGAQEMMVGSTATLVGIVKDFAVWDLPFLFNNEQEADQVLDGPFGQALLAKLDEQGLVGLVYWENGFRNLTNSKRPVEKLEDLQGIKLRVMQNPVFLDLFNRMGANAVPMSFSELFTALETKTVDGQENPVTTIQSSKFYEVQQYLSLTRHVYSPWIMLASKSWWDKLSADEQQLIQQAALAARDYERQDSRAQSLAAMDFLKAQGMQINEVSPAELERMRAQAKATIEAQAQEIGPELVAELFAAIDSARH